MLTSILRYFRFAYCIIDFFSNYLVGRSTQYSWNSFHSEACNADVGVWQGSTLSSILSALYMSLFISQGKTYNKTLPELYSSYRVVTDLIVMFGLVMEHDKSEIFHFSRTYNNSNSELDLSTIGISILKSKTYWRYLGFYFNRCLSFKKHIHYYSTKVLSSVKVMGMLGNSTRGLLSL